MDSKEKYIEFCKSEPNIPIFCQPFWLDAVSVNSWNVSIVESGGEVVASMPYTIDKMLWFSGIKMPPLTQSLGPYIKYPKGQKNHTKLSWEKKVMTELINQLPRFDFFISISTTQCRIGFLFTGEASGNIPGILI